MSLGRVFVRSPSNLLSSVQRFSLGSPVRPAREAGQRRQGTSLTKTFNKGCWNDTQENFASDAAKRQIVDFIAGRRNIRPLIVPCSFKIDEQTPAASILSKLEMAAINRNEVVSLLVGPRNSVTD